MNLVIVGFMGAGKTSVARELAKILNIPTVDLDAVILKTSNFDTIADIFNSLGESAFRDMESNALKRTLDQGNAIVSTGGGIVEREENRSYLRESSYGVVYLKADFEVVQNRIGNDSQRPLFKDLRKAQLLFEHRLALYDQVSDYEIDTNQKSVEEVAHSIFEAVRTEAVDGC